MIASFNITQETQISENGCNCKPLFHVYYATNLDESTPVSEFRRYVHTVDSLDNELISNFIGKGAQNALNYLINQAFHAEDKDFKTIYDCIKKNGKFKYLGTIYCIDENGQAAEVN